MKFLFLLLLISCSKKYQTFNTIKKGEFEFGKPHSPISPKMYQGKKVIQKSCEGQIFFSKNALKITEASIPALISYSCPDSEYLLNAKITQTWWTMIIYSKSCVELVSHCPLKRK